MIKTDWSLGHGGLSPEIEPHLVNTGKIEAKLVSFC
jgi:hypothetical protein